MKILISYKVDSRGINSVRNLEHYMCQQNKTEHDIISAVSKANEDVGKTLFKVVDIPNNLEEVMDFCLGDNGYKKYADIDNLDDSINNVSALITNAYDTIYDISNSMENIEAKFEEIKKRFEKMTN